MKYHYQCSDTDNCSFVTEIVQAMSAPLKDITTCGRCGKDAKHIFEGAPAVATANMFNQPIDVAIGRDAHMRWASIESRQEKRDKIRKDSGQQGLTATSYDEFVPVTEAHKQKRTTASAIVGRDGFKQVFDSKAETEVMTQHP